MAASHQTPICSQLQYELFVPFASFPPVQTFCSQKFPVAAVTSTSTFTPPSTSVATLTDFELFPTTSTSVTTEFSTTVVATVTSAAPAGKRDPLSQKSADTLLAKFSGFAQRGDGYLSTACSCIEIPRTVQKVVTASEKIIPATTIVTSFITSETVVASTTVVEVDVTTTVAPPASASNVLQNGGFEISSDGTPLGSVPEGWSVTDGAEQLVVGSGTDGAHSGVAVADIDVTGSQEISATVYQTLTNLTPNTLYTINFWYNVQQITTGVSCQLKTETDNHPYLDTLTFSSANGVWTQRQLTFTSSSASDDLYLSWSCPSASGNGDNIVWLDDVSLTPAVVA